MKTLIISLLMMVLPFLSTAQIFQKYENMEQVDVMVITQNMFELLSGVNVENKDPEMQHFINLAQSLKGIKVYSTQDETVGEKMQADAKNYISSTNLDVLMRVKEDGKRLKFYSKPGSTAGKISQLFMFMTDSEDGKKEYVMLSITGNIDLNEVSRIASVLHDVPGAEEMKNIQSE